MPTNVSEISTENWQVSTGAFGEIVQGNADIVQAIGIILNTVPGSDPLRPSFGSDLFKQVDAPAQQARANIKRIITQDVEFWEPRVRVTDVNVILSEPSAISVWVSWRLLVGDVSGDEVFTFTFDGSGAISQPPVINFTNPTLVSTVVSDTINWQISTAAFGATVQGANEISQAISIAVSNLRGSDVLRPLFGSGIWQYVDYPLNVAGAQMCAAIREAVAIWEQRVELTEVSYTYRAQPDESVLSGLIFRIGWRLVGETLSGQTDLLLQAENEGSELAPATLVVRILATESNEAIATEANELIEV